MEKEKQVDESWKDDVLKEKEIEPDSHSQGHEEGEMEVNFVNYITSLVLQALIFLGEIPNPMADNKTESNLPQAKFLIDTLILIREKTKGNLSPQEADLLNSSLYELQMKFIERSQTPSSGGGEGPAAGQIIQPE